MSSQARYKVDVAITPGAHMQETQVNKQLADKERVAAALENGRCAFRNAGTGRGGMCRG